MNNEAELNILFLASYLLQYPDRSWRDQLLDAAAGAEEMKSEIYAEPILEFLKFAQSTEELDLAELYTNTFDFSKKTNLYLTYYLFKEQRERGSALLELKRQYTQAGFIMDEKELPDFLPVMLEFAAASKSKSTLCDYMMVIEDIYNILSERNNPYSNVLKSILLIMSAQKNDSKQYSNALSQKMEFQKEV